MRPYLWCGVLLLAALPARAEPPAPKLVKETWDAAYLEGARCGYFRTAVQEIDQGKTKVLRTTLEMNLRVKRYNAVVPLRMETGDDETAEGKVVAVSLTQFDDKGRRLTQSGAVQGDRLLVRTPADQAGKLISWNGKVLGMAKQDQLFKDRRAKPGDTFEFLSFEPSLLAAVTVRAAVKGAEEVDLLEARKEGDALKVERVKKKLLRVEAKPDKIEVQGNAIQLPKLVSWLDQDWQTVRSEMDLPGLGKVTLYRTTPEVAKLEGAAPELLPDLGLNTLIAVQKRVENLHAAAGAVYRITIKEDDDPATTFARDARQAVKNVKDGGFELHVRPVREAAPLENPGAAKPEFLASSHFLDCADEKVKALAAEAAGRETDPWRKAQRIEKWVHANMKGSSAVGFATAGQVARDLQGDCRQHAMLAVAMCRAAGVPARTAVGLVYVKDSDKGPFFGFHMWTEVWVKGQWLGLDATLGQGSVGPGHLKIADHSWHDTQTLAPLLPVLRVMGKATIEIIKVEEK